MNHEEQQFFKDIDVRPSNTVGRLRSEDKPSDCIHAVRGWVDRAAMCLSPAGQGYEV